MTESNHIPKGLDQDKFPLHTLATYSHEWQNCTDPHSYIDELVKKHPVDAYNDAQRTPLHLATLANNFVFAQELLRLGANPNSTTTESMTPLMLTSDSKVLNLLLENGADAKVLDAQNRSVLMWYLHNLGLDAQMVQLLIEKGGNLSTKDKEQKWDALFYCFHGSCVQRVSESKDIFEVLINAGADTQTTDIAGQTLLMKAISTPLAVDSVKFLLHKNTDVNQIDNNRKHSLIYLTEKYSSITKNKERDEAFKQILLLLKDRQINYDHKDASGMSAFDYLNKTKDLSLLEIFTESRI